MKKLSLILLLCTFLMSCTKQNNIPKKTPKHEERPLMNYYIGKIYMQNGTTLPFKMCTSTVNNKAKLSASFNNGNNSNLVWFDLLGSLSNNTLEINSNGSLYSSNGTEYFYEFNAKNNDNIIVGNLNFMQSNYKVLLHEIEGGCPLDLLNPIAFKTMLNNDAKISQGTYLGCDVLSNESSCYKICVKSNELLGYKFFVNKKSAKIEGDYSQFIGYLNQNINMFSRGIMINKKYSSGYQFSYINQESNNYRIMRLSESGEFNSIINLGKTSNSCDKKLFNF